MTIVFTESAEIDFRLKDKSRLREWINKVVESEKKKVSSLNFLFTSDHEVWLANRKYLHHDTYTDIITFGDSKNERIEGDILISVERVKENSEKYKVAFENELRRVMIHGVLHLCGYADKNKIDREKMRELEDRALRLYARMLK
jgi:probable rRNA maturation factor